MTLFGLSDYNRMFAYQGMQRSRNVAYAKDLRKIEHNSYSYSHKRFSNNTRTLGGSYVGVSYSRLKFRARNHPSGVFVAENDEYYVEI